MNVTSRHPCRRSPGCCVWSARTGLSRHHQLFSHQLNQCFCNLDLLYNKKKTNGNLSFYSMEEKKENAYQLDIFKGAVSWIFLPFGRARPAISSCFQEQFGVHYHAQGLKHLDYSIDSRITPACIRSIRLDSDFTFCAGSRLSPGVRNSGGSGFPPKSLQAMPLCI